MPKLRVHNFTLSLDGYAAGPRQRMDAPFGDGVEGLHDWMVATRTFRATHGLDGGEEGPDDERVRRAEDGIGATIMGRNMFGPQRGPWADHSWRGWWGPNPPYHNDVFVMTHHVRPTLAMEGGTTFHFVDDTPGAVLERAFDAAGGKDVLVAGGAATIRQFLREGLVDDLYLVIAPILAGAGERLLGDLDLGRYEVADTTVSQTATHVHITRRATR
ncbi:dihydrofolate reductase family protein [Nonomuraea muscovyensis]|uniref:Dihydrofolate reductase n=1 Tax=Nonomuraea muscovyensis TaxID=1124761 RepID=A0A7X0F1G1_9ACTN|nr:dihydrofolate reductase family protein [Nonomuraea muscovyensis]MBB6349519.1 dihydrofolate reductase [Nonomuraea muscovyensis]